MPSINPEMLKQLLQEFEEKQAVCREEIIAISEQIGELEKRITSSKERLTSVARDREKVGQMRKRYADGDWSAVIQTLGQNGGRTMEQTPAPSRMTTIMDSIPPVEVAPQPGFEYTQQQPVADTGSIAQQIMPEYTVPAAPSPQQVDAMMSNQPMPQFQGDQPSWDPPPQPDYTPSMPEPIPIISPPQPGEGLFSFSGQPQEVVEGAPQADIPWAPPPSMTWESVAGHTFPSPDQQQQPQAYPPPGFADPSQYGAQQPLPAQAPLPMQDPVPPPAFDLGQPPQPGVPVTKDYDEEFDISDALRGDDDTSPSSGDGSNEKKIKDALRGLFS
ncbi:MAG: hypothetical protein K2X93_09970 [Candidatus Obscuribacterales bacterium]|nr:hypothetical protein [Candidatus Obscuribacterales bacterium]